MLQYDVGSTCSTSSSLSSSSPTPATFDLGVILGSVALGRDVSGCFALSIAGIAVLCPNGTWVTLDKDKDSLIDVTPLVLTGLDPWVVRLPVSPRSLRRGDLIVALDTPFSPLFVLDAANEKRVLALSPIAGQVVTFAPPRNLLLDFVVQVVSLFDLAGGHEYGEEVEEGARSPGPAAEPQATSESPSQPRRRGKP